jgi:hypothetical protein
MRPDLRLIHDSSVPKPVPIQLETKPRAGPDPQALWLAFVAAQERSKATLAVNDGIAAGKAYAAFLLTFVNNGRARAC